MRRKTFLLCLLALLTILPARAWEYRSVADTTVQAVQLRVGADWTKKWHCGVRLGISEELRFDVYNSSTGANFNRSYTTLTFAYAPIPYFKMDAGYTLKIYGTKNWSDYNKWLRHRVFFGVTGSYSWDLVKLSLREHVLCDMRTDSVNLLEKNRYEWSLRSRLSAEFKVPNYPVKPYCWVEVCNTLNAPEYQQFGGMQYVNQVRTQVGVKWRLTQRNSLDFYYRFVYGYDRDVNITKTKGYIDLTRETTYRHCIGIAYHFDY